MTGGCRLTPSSNWEDFAPSEPLKWKKKPTCEGAAKIGTEFAAQISIKVGAEFGAEFTTEIGAEIDAALIEFGAGFNTKFVAEFADTCDVTLMKYSETLLV